MRKIIFMICLFSICVLVACGVYIRETKTNQTPNHCLPYISSLYYKNMSDEQVMQFEERAESVCREFNQIFGYKGYKAHELLTGTTLTVTVYSTGDECYGASPLKTCAKRLSSDINSEGNSYEVAIYKAGDLWYKCAVKHEFAHVLLYELEKKTGLVVRSEANGESEAIKTANERHHFLMKDKNFSRLDCSHLFNRK